MMDFSSILHLCVFDKITNHQLTGKPHMGHIRQIATPCLAYMGNRNRQPSLLHTISNIRCCCTKKNLYHLLKASKQRVNLFVVRKNLRIRAKLLQTNASEDCPSWKRRRCVACRSQTIYRLIPAAQTFRTARRPTAPARKALRPQSTAFPAYIPGSFDPEADPAPRRPRRLTRSVLPAQPPPPGPSTKMSPPRDIPWEAPATGRPLPGQGPRWPRGARAPPGGSSRRQSGPRWNGTAHAPPPPPPPLDRKSVV